MTKKKTLNNTNVTDARMAAPGLQIIGNGDLWKLLCKVSSESEDWMKSTKVMEIEDAPNMDDNPGERYVAGCLVQVTTQQGDNVAEAITYVPNVRIAECGTKLEHTSEW